MSVESDSPLRSDVFITPVRERENTILPNVRPDDKPQDIQPPSRPPVPPPARRKS